MKPNHFYTIFILYCFNYSNSLVWYGNFADFANWNIKYSYLAENRQVVNDPLGGTDKVLKVKYPAGSYSTHPTQKGGTGFFIYPFENITIEQASLEYDVLFPLDFDFVKGGKLPGLFGGRKDCSGGDMALDCFSARFMFGSNGWGYAYLYVSKLANHSQEFCTMSGVANCAPDWGYGIGGSKYFDKGKWVRIKELIRLNTPGQQNGRFAIWIDDVLKFDFYKMVFRTNSVPISGIAFETFFGGNTPDWATPKEVFSYYKNFKFDTLSIQPTTTASPQLASLYAQCGGQGWTGPVNCVSGAVCVVQNQFYSQCLPK